MTSFNSKLQSGAVKPHSSFRTPANISPPPVANIVLSVTNIRALRDVPTSAAIAPKLVLRATVRNSRGTHDPEISNRQAVEGALSDSGFEANAIEISPDPSNHTARPVVTPSEKAP